MKCKNVFVFLILIFSLSSCITTISPGLLFNNTAEHVYKDRSSSQLGSGRILKMEKSCSYNSIVFAFFLSWKSCNCRECCKRRKNNEDRCSGLFFV